MTKRDQDIVETEISSSPAVLSMLHSSEIDIQIATAHKFPRSISQFRKDVFDMVAISEAVAAECTYALPRDGKMVEGPSARFAEIIASAWGNARAGARVVDEGPQFITSQGVFHDLQKNVAITFEVQRRITNKKGVRYNDDMIVTTGNAASSIALRNAVLKGIPKAFWAEMWDAARRVALGDAKTLPTRRAEAFAAAQKFGVTKEQACAKLGARGEEDVGLEQLMVLRGILTAIREGDTTAEQAFAPDDADKAPAPMPQRASAQSNATQEAVPKPASNPGAPVVAPAPPPVDDDFVRAMDAAERGEPDPETGEVPAPLPTPPERRPIGELATPGEVANIKRRAEGAGMSLPTLLQTMGMTHLLPDLNGMSKEDFKVLKVKLS